MKRLLIAAIAVLGLAGCSQARFQATWNYGQAARATCYSGGEIVLDDYSTGRVENESGSDGFHYVSATTHRLMHLSGQCFFNYGDTPSASFKPILPGQQAMD
jgi:hypothetical protein